MMEEVTSNSKEGTKEKLAKRGGSRKYECV